MFTFPPSTIVMHLRFFFFGGGCINRVRSNVHKHTSTCSKVCSTTWRDPPPLIQRWIVKERRKRVQWHVHTNKHTHVSTREEEKIHVSVCGPQMSWPRVASVQTQERHGELSTRGRVVVCVYPPTTTLLLGVCAGLFLPSYVHCLFEKGQHTHTHTVTHTETVTNMHSDAVTSMCRRSKEKEEEGVTSTAEVS